MSDFTTNSVSLPIPSNDSRPLPEIIAEFYGFPLAYHDTNEGRYYAVQDWIVGVAQTDDATTFWVKLKKRLAKAKQQLLPPCQQLPYVASNGKTYKMDHAQAQTLYQITQRMDANTGLRNKILEFLSKAGVVVDDFRIDPDQAIDAAIEGYKRQGKSEKWIVTRIQSKAMRLRFTSAFRNALKQEPSPIQYAQITDVMRLGVWKRSTAALRTEMGLTKNDNVRDNMSSLALSFELLAENMSATDLERRQQLTFEESKGIVRTLSEHVGRYADDASKVLGIDIPTNKPLLKDKQ